MNKTEKLIADSQAGDNDALDTLIKENAGLIWAVAMRFTGRGAETDDLYQLGCLGFIKAVKGFDPAYGTQFSTYAVPKISGEIRRFLRDDGSVKVSRTIKEQAGVIKTAQSKLSIKLGREPSIREISGETGFSAEEIANAELATQTVQSIQAPSGSDGFTLENTLSDPASEEKMLEHIALNQAIDQLEDREKMAVQLRFFHGLTQEQTARIMHVSQVQVSRIEKRAIESLRKLMN